MDAVGEHYFTTEPRSGGELRPLSVRLVGRDLQLATSGGVFSPNRVDTGTQVLLRSAPDPPASGTFLDLGCGWGPLAISLALLAPNASIWAVDVNQRALDLVRGNVAAAGLTNVSAALPDEVPDDVRFDAIWSNPPIRIGKPALHDLLLRWLPRLERGAQAHLVVQKHLGADSLLRWLNEQGLPTDRVATGAGFRVLRVVPH
jgi:16S rRNA G1207 methylase RsmC